MEDQERPVWRDEENKRLMPLMAEIMEMFDDPSLREVTFNNILATAHNRRNANELPHEDALDANLARALGLLVEEGQFKC